jgi:protein-disulfide isomerase
MKDRLKLMLIIVATALFCMSLPLHAQFAGNAAAGPLQNLATLKPPAGSKVAIVVFEDLGCPACAHAHPIELQVAAKEHVPIVRYDFPLAAHVWTFQGAVCARYIQNKINPQLADQYRSDVFAAQQAIASKDDLQRFTQTWMRRHGQQMPFVMDPDGSLAKAVTADYNLGLRIHMEYTPTVIVVSREKQQVVCGAGPDISNPDRLLPVVEAAVAQTAAPVKNKHTATTSVERRTTAMHGDE